MIVAAAIAIECELAINASLPDVQEAMSADAVATVASSIYGVRTAHSAR